MRYNEIIKESSGPNQFALMQQAIYRFVLQHLQADPEIKEDLQHAMGSDEFWVAEFDDAYQAIIDHPTNYQAIVDPLYQAVEAVARSMKSWLKDPMNFAPGWETVDLDITPVLNADLGSLITALAPQAKQGADDQEDHTAELAAQQVKDAQNFIKYASVNQAASWDSLLVYLKSRVGKAKNLTDDLPPYMAAHIKEVLSASNGAEVRALYKKYAPDALSFLKDTMETVSQHVDEHDGRTLGLGLQTAVEKSPSIRAQIAKALGQ